MLVAFRKRSYSPVREGADHRGQRWNSFQYGQELTQVASWISISYRALACQHSSAYPEVLLTPADDDCPKQDSMHQAQEW